VKVATLTQTVVVENVAKPAEVLRTLFVPLLDTVRQKSRQEVAKAKRTKVPHAGCKEPQRPDSCVMLVESDIYKDIHSIMP
jgi:hypothetical protein